jgi:DNA repair protein RadD
VDEALQQVDQLRRPIAIQVRPAGQYTEIAATRFV